YDKEKEQADDERNVEQPPDLQVGHEPLPAVECVSQVERDLCHTSNRAVLCDATLRVTGAIAILCLAVQCSSRVHIGVPVAPGIASATALCGIRRCQYRAPGQAH